MASISNAPWDGSASNYKDANAYCAACLIDTNQGTKLKPNCKLPVREPGGALNRNAIHAAASVLAGGMGGVNASPADKQAAAKKLVGMYGQMNEDPPASLSKMAKMMGN